MVIFEVIKSKSRDVVELVVLVGKMAQGLGSTIEGPICKCEDASRKMGVPETVTVWPPGTMLMPLMSNPVGATVKTCSPTVRTLLGTVGNIIVMLSICSAPCPNETMVLEIVTGGPRGNRLVLASEKPPRLAVKA